MDGGIISYEQATGAAPWPAASGDDALPALTVTRSPAKPTPIAVDPPSSASAAAPQQMASPVGAAASPKVIPYEEAVAADSPHPEGSLSNAPDDSLASGAGKAVGTTVIKGLSHIPGMFGDAMDFGDYLIARGLSKVTGRPVEDILKENAAATKAGSWADPRNFLPSGPDISDQILAKTGEYKPTSEPGKLAMAAGETALGGMVGGAGPARLAANALAGGVGQGVTDVTGDPLAGAVGGIVAGHAAPQGVRAVEKVAGPAIMGAPGIDRVPIVGPAVAAARDNAAATRILSQSSDPGAAIAWAREPVEPSLTPNAPQTTAGAIGTDRGLFQAEKDARNANNLPFNAVDKAQSDAHQAALGGMQPEGDVFRPGQVIRDRLASVDQAVQAAHANLEQQFAEAHAAATQRAQEAAHPLMQGPTPEQTGAALRTAQQEATQAAKEHVRSLYDAVDPDGTLTTVVAPVKAAKQAIAGAIDPHAGVQPSGAEAKLWSDIDRLPDVVPFKSLQALDSRVTAAMADARRNPSADDPQAIARLTQLKSAVMDAIHNGVENQAAHEARLAEAGLMPAEQTLESRLNDFWGVERAEPVGGVATGTGPNAFVPSGRASSGSSRSIGTGASAAGRFGAAPSDQGISTPAGKSPQSLVAFLRAAGGIKDHGGELFARELHKQFPGLVNNRAGLSLDYAREAAAEAGYLGADTGNAVRNTDINDLLHAIDSHPVYSVHDEAALARRADAVSQRSYTRDVRAAADEIRSSLAASGHDPRSVNVELLHDAAEKMVQDRLPWDEALEKASDDALFNETEGAREAQYRASQEQGYNDPSHGDAAARRGEEGTPESARGAFGVSGEARANFDQGAVERLNAAKAAYSAYAQTFKNPTVKGTLETNGFAGQFKAPNSAIPSKWVVSGDRGYDTARAFLAAAANDPRAVSAMQDAALAPLRKAVQPIGNVPQRVLDRWKGDYDGALRAIDEVSPGFSSRFDNAATATDAVLDLGVQQRQAMQTFQQRAAAAALERQSSPAGKLAAAVGGSVAPAEVENTVGNMLKTGTGGATRMRALVQSVSADPDALAGLRKAGVDWLLRSFQNADGSLSGAKFISFVRGNRDTLKELYPTNQVAMMGAIAERIEADARWRTETAIKAGSDTAKNMKPMLEAAVDKVNSHVSIMGAATAGFLAGGPKGALGGASLFLLNSLRGAGIRSVDDLYREALVKPEVARYLISKMPESPEGGKLRALAGALRRDLVTGAVQTEQTRGAR